jgi:adenosylmethionine-8-amino-7-oxononanoate aminotransferase
MNVKQRDRRFLARESEPEDVEVVRTEGSYVIDARGRKSIDFLSGWCVGNFGWGNKAIRQSIARFRGPDYVYPEYLYAPWGELAELLAEITPGKLQKCYRATGGSEAVEIALQLAMASTKRRKFVAIEGSYHGNTIGSVSVASSEEREMYPNLLAGCLKVKPPLDERAAEKVERMLEARDVAALIMEPIGLNLGVLIPDRAFMTRVQQLCRRYGTLLIMDEVATGFGRTGALFACEHFGVEPDILCMAKAITGGYAPMGATIATGKVASSVDDVSFYSTYGWHPLAVAAAIANVRWLIRNRTKLLKQVNALGEFFRSRLLEMNFRHAFKVRVKGLAIGVETGEKDYAENITEKCRRKGLLLTTSDDILTMFPPLTMTRHVAAEGLEILEKCVR